MRFNKLFPIFLLVVSSTTRIAAISLQDQDEKLSITTEQFSSVVINKSSGVIERLTLREIEGKSVDPNILPSDYESGFAVLDDAGNVTDRKLSFSSYQVKQTGPGALEVVLTGNGPSELESYSKTFSFSHPSPSIAISHQLSPNGLQVRPFVSMGFLSLSPRPQSRLASYFGFLGKLRPFKGRIAAVQSRNFVEQVRNAGKDSLNTIKVEATDKTGIVERKTEQPLNLGVLSKYFFSYSSLTASQGLVDQSKESLQVSGDANSARATKYLTSGNQGGLYRSDGQEVPVSFSVNLYCGNRTQEALKSIPDFSSVLTKVSIDHGRFIGAAQRFMGKILKFLTKLLGNITLASLLVAFFLRLLNMQLMNCLKNPVLKELSELESAISAGSSRAQNQRAELVRKNSVLLGFMPVCFILILVQVLLAFGMLFFLQTDSAVYGSSFLWLDNVAGPDPYLVLPLLAFISQLFYVDSFSGAYKYAYFAILALSLPSLSASVLLQLIFGGILKQLGEGSPDPVVLNQPNVRTT